MGIQIEYSDTRIVKWGNETERKNKIYIDQIIADIKVFSRFYACDNPQLETKYSETNEQS